MNELKEDPLVGMMGIAWRAMVRGLARACSRRAPPVVVVILRVRTIIACAALSVSGSAFCAAAVPTANDSAPGLAPESASFRQPPERDRHAETLKTSTT